MNQLGKNPPKQDTTDMLWAVWNIGWPLCTYAEDNGLHLRTDMIAITSGGENVFQNQNMVFDPQRKQMQSITECYKYY